jgi:primase-polymerase (primpol)-like protein
LFFIDLDGVYNPETGVLKPEALAIINMFDGCYREISRSGTGVHIIGVSRDVIPSKHRCRLGVNIEFYTAKKTCTLTGKYATGMMDFNATEATRRFCMQFPVADAPVITQRGPDADYNGPADDAELVRVMLSSAGSFATQYGERCHVAALWNGDGTTLREFYPAAEGRSDGLTFDASAVDLALCGHLAFWAGRDPARIERLWLMSPMGQRQKTQTRADYRNRTISIAVANKTIVYNQEYSQILESCSGDNQALDVRPTIMTLDEMLANLVYVSSTQEVVHLKYNRVRLWQSAIGDYAASMHCWETETGKIKEVPALLAWRKHPNRITVDCRTWQPNGPRITMPAGISEGNSRAVNGWTGFMPLDVPPDWITRLEPFAGHVAYLVPDAVERHRFLQWCAHMVQQPDELPHTCYLMVTKRQGIGRNWLGEVLALAMRGYVAGSVSLGQLLDGGFNGVLSQKILAVVDEVREGMSEKKYAKAQAFKQLISQRTRLINGKYERQVVEHNCLRWLLFSNHLDALPLDGMDRRVRVIRNPETPRSPETYTKLYAALSDCRFIASVYEYLRTYSIEGFNAGEIAPLNSAKADIIAAGQTQLEQLVCEFRDECRAPITTLDVIRRYVAAEVQVFSDRQLRHAIDAAGLTVSASRLKVGNKRCWLVGVTIPVDATRSWNIDEIATAVAASGV